jgi:hypothetical protein
VILGIRERALNVLYGHLGTVAHPPPGARLLLG